MTNAGENNILCHHSNEAERVNQANECALQPDPGGDLIVLVGPTAVGKTSVAIELAALVGGEIVSADSMQVYRLLDVGTAKPTTEQREQAQFHLIDIADPDQQLTVSEWKARASKAIDEIRGSGKAPIVCGGTGLYIKALLYDWSLAETPADPQIRTKLVARSIEEGSQELHIELAGVDPITASRLHPNDTVRIVRALEVFYVSGIAISEYPSADKSRSARLPARQFGLMLPRQEMYDRIDSRVDHMLTAGLEQEVRELLTRGYGLDHGPLRSLGYKEMVQYVLGQLDYPQTVSAIKQSTRRYAKRQMAWFRGDASIHWIDVSALSSAAVAGYIRDELERSNTISDP